MPWWARFRTAASPSKRFRDSPNIPVQVRETLYWDVLALYNNILEGLRAYVRRHGAQVEGIGIDTWGVDFGLLSAQGELLQNPVHYRDSRTAAMMEQVKLRISPEELFRSYGDGASTYKHFGSTSLPALSPGTPFWIVPQPC